MTERETDRLIAWSTEMRVMHARIREALEVTREAVRGEPPNADDVAMSELLMYCHGFCTALDGHHQGEDRALFPAIETAHPELTPVLRALQRDHSMIAHLLQGLRNAVDRSSSAAELDRHLDGIAAVMETHFRYEEKQLLTVLASLSLDAPVPEVLGPL